MKIRVATAFLLLFGLFSCETEPVTKPQQPIDELAKQEVLHEEHGYVEADDIPQVVNILGKVSESPSGNAKMIYHEGAVIDLNTIVRAKGGEHGKTNYTFPILSDKQPEGEFYNLIVPVDDNGEILKPYVRRYVVNPDDLAEYRSSGYDFAKFKGRFYKYSYKEFFDSLNQFTGKGTMRTGNCDDGGTPIGGGSGGSAPIENPDLITVDGTNNWNGIGQIGYISFPSWSAGTSSQSYTTGSNVNNDYRESEEYAETVSTYGVANVNYGTTIAVVDWSQVVAVNVTVSITGGAGEQGAPCVAKVTRTVKYLGGLVITTTETMSCEDMPHNKSTVVYGNRNSDCDNGDDGNVGIINIGVIINLKNKLGLEVGSAPYQWLLANPEEATMLNNFVNQHTSDGIVGAQAKAYAYSALDDMMDGYEVLSIAPPIKYPKNSNYASQYPKLTEYLKNQLPTLSENQTIVNAFKEFTNMTESQIEDLLAWGSGPELVIEQLGVDKNGDYVLGKFDKTKPGQLSLDIDFVNNLENAQSGSTLSESLVFYIGVAILHEAVHYGDFHYNNDYWTGNDPTTDEEGWLFIIEVYGGSIWINNDGEIEITPFD